MRGAIAWASRPPRRFSRNLLGRTGQRLASTWRRQQRRGTAANRTLLRRVPVGRHHAADLDRHEAAVSAHKAAHGRGYHPRFGGRRCWIGADNRRKTHAIIVLLPDCPDCPGCPGSWSKRYGTAQQVIDRRKVARPGIASRRAAFCGTFRRMIGKLRKISVFSHRPALPRTPSQDTIPCRKPQKIRGFRCVHALG